ncbi:hypothetical protein IW146_007613, partial [Coemansia sp. RSA 922]
MPEEIPSGCTPEHTADFGFKRAASPGLDSNVNMADEENTSAVLLPSAHEQKRAKLT